METLITAGVTILAGGGGLFALMRYIIKEHNRAMQLHTDTFMEYIQKKNGVNERIAETFAKATVENNKRYDDLLKEIIKNK